jgi:signal transduction histidine kinase
VLHLAVTDDGCGVDPGSAQAGVGVLSMATRAEELGGSFSLAPEPGGGTRMTATLPLTARREAAPEAGG